MTSRARRLMTQTGPWSLIVVDYIQIMRVAKSKKEQNLSRTELISELSHELKNLACELNCPVIALWQLSCSLEKRSDRRPLMSDLPDAIEQDADVVLFLYRDVVYNNTPHKNLCGSHCPVSTLSLVFNTNYSYVVVSLDQVRKKQERQSHTPFIATDEIGGVSSRLICLMQSYAMLSEQPRCVGTELMKADQHSPKNPMSL